MNKRTFIKNLSLTVLTSLLPNIAISSQSYNVPTKEIMTKWYPILAFKDNTINPLVKLETAIPLKDQEYIYDYSFLIPKEQVYQCVNEMETLEIKCKALEKLELSRQIRRVLHLGIPSIRRRFGKKDNIETDSLILFKEVNEKGILVNLEKSKWDDLFISWNAWILAKDITSWTSMPYDTVFVDYIRDEQYRLTPVNKVV